jgi:hypothetical protein
MKQISSLIAAAALFAACNSNPRTDANVKPLTAPGVTILADTSGLSEFQAWKAQKDQGLESNAIAPGSKTVVAYADDNNSAVRNAAPVRKSSVARRSTSTRSRTANRTYSSGSSTVYEPAATTTVPARKKGWSKAAKGAAIGGAGGAIAGAIIGKNNRALGAVIGGVVGGGVGYGIGRSKDKKDGRY